MLTKGDLGLEARDCNRKRLHCSQWVLKVHGKGMATHDSSKLQHDSVLVGLFTQLKILDAGNANAASKPSLHKLDGRRFGGDAQDAYAHSPPPSTPTFVRIDDQYPVAVAQRRTRQLVHVADAAARRAFGVDQWRRMGRSEEVERLRAAGRAP